MTAAAKWFAEMQSIWIEKRPDDIGALLSDDGFNYYEHPFHEPLNTKEQVIGAWQEIKSQDIEDITINMLYDNGDIAFAKWEFKMKDEPLHIGSYFLKLDTNGKCKEFRQWWNVE